MGNLIHHCRALAHPLGRVGLVAMALVTGHLVLLALILLWGPVHVVGVALWEGIRPRVVAFGSASSFAFFGWLRCKLRLPPEKESSDRRQ
jgi:hypothetical protein